LPERWVTRRRRAPAGFGAASLIYKMESDRQEAQAKKNE